MLIYIAILPEGNSAKISQMYLTITAFIWGVILRNTDREYPSHFEDERILLTVVETYSELTELLAQLELELTSLAF